MRDRWEGLKMVRFKTTTQGSRQTRRRGEARGGGWLVGGVLLLSSLR